jgi:hypothetical protein
MYAWHSTSGKERWRCENVNKQPLCGKLLGMRSSGRYVTLYLMLWARNDVGGGESFFVTSSRNQGDANIVYHVVTSRGLVGVVDGVFLCLFWPDFLGVLIARRCHFRGVISTVDRIVAVGRTGTVKLSDSLCSPGSSAVKCVSSGKNNTTEDSMSLW